MILPMPRTLCLIALLLTLPAFSQTRDDYLRLSNEMRQHFDTHILKTWFPVCIDHAKGGFRSNLSRDWKSADKQDRFLVFQSRMTWVAAQVALHRPELKEQYLNHARHGAAGLAKMWDPQHGGLFWGLDDHYQIDPKYRDVKHAYGISFGIYALAASHQATGDADSIDLAMKTFRWFDLHAHDNANGGYHEALQRDGTPIVPADLTRTLENRSFGPNVVLGYKSMNSHIHLLEAFTQLYHVKKDDLVRQRLEELFLIVRDKIYAPPGCLNLFFTPDWRPVPDHDSFGHDIETAFLLLEAAELLKRPDDNKTLRVARSLVDHALDWGFDKQRGGFYDRGAAFAPPFALEKVWWTQAEGLNALLLMHEHFGKQTDRYWKAFTLTWKFVNDHMVDKEHGGWYATLEPDGKPLSSSKAHNWKAAYHDGRALLNMHQRLARLAN